MFYTSVEFADMQQKTIIWKEDQDCCVKAMAIALDIPYAKAWYACRKFGRIYKEGMFLDDLIKAVESLDYKTEKLLYTGHWHDFIRTHRDGTYLIDTQMPRHSPYNGMKHLHVYKDGIMHDAPINWAGEAIDCYKVVHNDDYISPLHIYDTGTSGTWTSGMG